MIEPPSGAAAPPPLFPVIAPPPVAPPPSKTPVILLTAIITAVVVSLVWGLALGGIAYFYTRNIPSFAVTVDAPSHVEVGDTLDLDIEIRNPGDALVTLDSIGISDRLSAGFKVTGVSPAASVVPDPISGASFYFFSKSLSRDESLDVTFTLEAVKPGIWTGDLDFHSPSQSFVTSSKTIRVDAPGTHSKAAEAEDRAKKPPFVLDIKTPHAVTLGENFTLHVSVTNPSDSPLFLEVIDLGGTLPEGLAFQSASPPPESNQNDEKSWALYYSKPLLPRETFSTEIIIKAAKEGIWTGDLDFWNQESEEFVSSSVTIRVNPSPAGKTPDPD